VTRDHLLFLLIGLLAGFLLGYIAHETMSGVQPSRVAAGAAAAPVADEPQADAGGAPAGGPPMAEINRLRALVEQNPNDRDALRQLANLNYDIANWPRAQELYERYLKLDPDNPDVLTDLGITLRSQGQLDRALELFRRAEKLRPDHWQARFNEIVVLAFDRKDFAAAERALAELERRAPGNANVQRLAEEVRKLKEGG
jgi:tetratricopeptide (TPR) repeat protein